MKGVLTAIDYIGQGHTMGRTAFTHELKALKRNMIIGDTKRKSDTKLCHRWS